MMNLVNQQKPPAGFTLIDMVVATAIIVTISAVLVVNFRVGKQRDELRQGALLLDSLLHQAQTYTLGGHTVDYGGPAVPPGGYGLSFDTQNEVVYFFGDGPIVDGLFSQGSEMWEEPYSLADYNITLDEDSVCVNLGSGCQPSVFTFEFLFQPPLGNRVLSGSTPNQGFFSVYVCHPSLAGKGMRLTGDAVTGQVDLGPMEDTSYCQP